MRPYQIAATERILNRIEVSTTYKQYGGIEAGGYIWHTTGSGKTLTSFKTAQLASKLPYIDKVLFVVDRKDLDYQTMKEYDRFEKGAANSNTSTAVLQRQMEDPDARIIITTIQKLDIFVRKTKATRRSGSILSSSSTSATAASSEICTKPLRRPSRTIICLASPARRSSPSTPGRAKSGSSHHAAGVR